jgi:serine/threonine protein phosphatase 1
MIYVTSDLHGIHPAEFQQLLHRSGFRDEDYLFILGDVIDRGEHGTELLLWLMEQTNMQLILGNHEALLLACSFLFDEVTDESLDRLTREQLMLLESWIANGGGPTIKGLQKLMHQSPALLDEILFYLQDAPLYEQVEIGGKNYILVHAGLDNFDPHRPLCDYEPQELMLVRPDLNTQYYHDATVIFGHTPTEFFGNAYQGRALRRDTWICIDTGAACGGLPMLLRLEDEKEFY